MRVRLNVTKSTNINTERLILLETVSYENESTNEKRKTRFDSTYSLDKDDLWTVIIKKRSISFSRDLRQLSFSIKRQ